MIMKPPRNMTACCDRRTTMLTGVVLAAVVTLVDAGQCPCVQCPCTEQMILPRTCEPGSSAFALPFCDAALSRENRVADLLSRLTREEKEGLVAQADTGFLPRLNLKQFKFFNTCMHGWWTSNVTTFPMPTTMAASFDTSLLERVGEVVGTESRALNQRDYNTSYDRATALHGVANNWLVCKDAAEVNMNRHPLWGRNPETYGEDPFLTSAMAEAFTASLQRSPASGGFLRTAAVTRHLVVYSGPESLKADGTQGENRFAFNANVTKRDLEDYFYPPFEACLDRRRGASLGAMCSDAAQNGVPSCASRLLMEELPRTWNASDDFFVVSDMDSYYNVYARHQYAANASDALLKDFAAGLDVLYLRSGNMQHVNETLDALHAMPDAVVDAKATKALALRFSVGEFDTVATGNPYASPVSASLIDSDAHREVAREAAAAGAVLLEHDGSTLPLDKGAKVALIGPWVQPSLQPSLGGGPINPYVHAYAGTSARMVDFRAGITEALATTPLFAQGCESNQTLPGQADFGAAKAVAQAADVAIVALGLTADVSDERGVGHEREMLDRLSLELPHVQQELLAAVHAVAKKVVLVLVAGSAVTFNASLADAVLYAGYGGAEAGHGLADVLFGDVVPSGRLPFTLFKSLDQMRPMEDYDLTEQPGRAHLYFDASTAEFGAPQYWFGYGLSYTRFEYSMLTLKLQNGTAAAASTAGGSCALTASVRVQNVGRVGGREVVQLYLNRPAAPTGTAAAPWPLRGFERTAVLAPGASATVSFVLQSRDLSHVLADGSRSVSQGTYTVSVGGSGPKDTRAPTKVLRASVTLQSTC